MATHATVCQTVPPWRRREVARNTGRKCERSQTSRGWKTLLRQQRKARERAALREALREV